MIRTYLHKIIDAIHALKVRKGASRQAIRSWIENEYGTVHAPALKRAFLTGISEGYLEPGPTGQRFRVTPQGKTFAVVPAKRKPKAKAKKKTTTRKKKKPASKALKAKKQRAKTTP
jgi:histone H1/5